MWSSDINRHRITFIIPKSSEFQNILYRMKKIVSPISLYYSKIYRISHYQVWKGWFQYHQLDFHMTIIIIKLNNIIPKCVVFHLNKFFNSNFKEGLNFGGTFLTILLKTSLINKNVLIKFIFQFPWKSFHISISVH